MRLREQETFILIHIENQSTARSDFPKRMFKYFAMLHQKFDLPIYPIAMFSYDKPLVPAADYYAVELFGLALLKFHFKVVQLNRLNWRDFLNRPSPVASALMAKMKIEPADRPRVKLECLRMLLTLKLDPARSELISVFMKSYLVLTAPEQLVYNQNVRDAAPEEREAVMKYTNEWFDEGHAKGVVKGQIELIDTQLKRRFGSVPPELSQSLGHLTADQINSFAVALLDFKSIPEATAWVAQFLAAAK